MKVVNIRQNVKNNEDIGKRQDDKWQDDEEYIKNVPVHEIEGDIDISEDRVKSSRKIARDNVENLRSLLSNCNRCSEGKDTGFSWNIWLDDKGKALCVKGHDAPIIWINDPENEREPVGLHNIMFVIRAACWKPEKSEAFEPVDMNRFSWLPPLPQNIKEMEELIVKRFNLLAKGAENIAKQEQVKGSFANQPWFIVMLDQKKYPSKKLLALNGTSSEAFSASGAKN